FELSRLGLVANGVPLGIERKALATLLDRSWTGGELELRGVLAAAAARARGPLVSYDDLEQALALSSETPPPELPALGHSEPPARTRARRPPRSRAHGLRPSPGPHRRSRRQAAPPPFYGRMKMP